MDTHDPLAEYRRTPLPPEGGAATPKGKEEYVAFATAHLKEEMPCLRIRRAKSLTFATWYNFLLTTAYDDEVGTIILLNFPFMKVKIIGKNLQDVVKALLRKTADYVREFDPARWAKPTDAKAPIIDSIEIVIEGKPSTDEMQL